MPLASPAPYQGRPRGRGLTGPAGWVGGWASPGSVFDHVREGVALPPDPPSPAGRARSLRSLVFLRAQREQRLGGPGTVLPARYTHPITHPVYPPWYTSRTPRVTAARVHRQRGTPGTCTYDRFRLVQGEPRGAEYTRVLGSHACILPLVGFTRPFDCN